MKALVAFALLAGSMLATPALAGALVVLGDTTGGPLWNRPFEGNPPGGLSATGPAVPYEVFEFSVTVDGTYDFVSTADGWDNYLFLYTGSFDPNDQLTNVLIGNDDFPGVGVSGFSYALTAGTPYLTVNTGFANSFFGTYTMEITGPGDILPVPEPASWAMLIVGFGVVGLSARRRRLALAR